MTAYGLRVRQHGLVKDISSQGKRKESLYEDKKEK
jgi:hypothetical protein